MNDKDEGLREAVKGVYEDIMLNEGTEYDTAESVAVKLGEILVNHPAPAEVEPLAVLADRKGKNYGHSLRIYRMPKGWVIDIIGLYRNTIIGCDTYAAAEAKARQYLESLPDKGGK